MRRFELTIECENAAFEGDDLYAELTRLLGDSIRRIAIEKQKDFYLVDRNGNSVGKARLVDEPTTYAYLSDETLGTIEGAIERLQQITLIERRHAEARHDSSSSMALIDRSYKRCVTALTQVRSLREIAGKDEWHQATVQLTPA